MVVLSVVVTVAVAMVVVAGMCEAVVGFGKVFLSQQKLYTHSWYDVIVKRLTSGKLPNPEYTVCITSPPLFAWWHA